MKVLPAMVMVAILCAPVFTDAWNLTVPAEEPEDPLVMVSHVALLRAVQSHATVVVTVMEPPAPAAATLTPVPLRV